MQEKEERQNGGNHQEEVLNHRYDVFQEQLPPCIEAYEELEQWHKKDFRSRKLPNTKKYFPKSS